MSDMMPKRSCHDAQTDAAAVAKASGIEVLRRQAARAAVSHWGALLLFFGGLHLMAAGRSAISGAVCAAVVLIVVHGLLGYRLSENCWSGSFDSVPLLGMANRLTLLRGLLVSLTAGFLVVRPEASIHASFLVWLPGGLYLTAALLDGVDGAWARRTGTQSALGQALDGDMDALGVLVACSLAVGSGRLPLYYLVAGLVYYLYQLGLWWRRHQGRAVYPEPPRQFARLVAGFQMGFLVAALLPVFSTEVLAVAAPVFLLPLLAGFVWDWVHVTGRHDNRIIRGWRAVRTHLVASGPKGLRVLMMGAVVVLFVWAWRDVSPAAVLAAIGLWGWSQWMIFAAVNLIILGAMCWRWWLILQRMGHPVGFAALVRYRMAANTVSYITPGPQFGGEPLQVLCLATRHGIPRESAAASVAVDRLAELMGNLLFLSLCGLFVLPPLMTDIPSLIAAATMMMLMVLAVGLLLRGVARGAAPLSRLAGWAVQWSRWTGRHADLVAFLQTGERRAAAILTDRLPGWYAGIGLVQWLAFLAELWLIYVFVGFAMSAGDLLTMGVAARLAFLLPLPGGLGALEAGQMLALISLGGDPSLAAAACAIMRLRDLVLISVGAVWAVQWRPPPIGKRPRPLDVT